MELIVVQRSLPLSRFLLSKSAVKLPNLDVPRIDFSPKSPIVLIEMLRKLAGSSFAAALIASAAARFLT